MENTPVYESVCLWDKLKSETRPIFLYGTGNGADKILDALLKINVIPEGVFASDGFVRSRTFRDYPVLPYSKVLEAHGEDIVVLLCFGTDRSEVVSFIEQLDRRHELYIPDVPLYDGDIFDMHYFEENKDRLMEVRSMLSDERSREFFDAAINFRLSGKYKYLLCTEEPKESLERLLNTEKIKVTCDLGAYKGDTAKLFFDTFTNSEKIYAVEPDPKTFLKLSAFAVEYSTVERRIIPLNFAASDKEDTVCYSGSASRGAGVMGKNHRAKDTTVACKPLDSVGIEKVDFIKYDVEGDEAAALVGSESTIRKNKPSLSVSLYHKTDDLFSLPLYIKKLLADDENYTFHLTRPFCIPAWDIMFYAVKH